MHASGYTFTALYTYFVVIQCVFDLTFCTYTYTSSAQPPSNLLNPTDTTNVQVPE